MNSPLKNKIKDCIQFCASQTMVNGLMSVYGGDRTEALFSKGQLFAVDKLVEGLYDGWNDNGLKIRQFNEVDHILKTINLTEDPLDLINNSLDLNTQSYTEALRLLFELGIKPEDVNASDSNLSLAQKYLVEVYRKLQGNNAFEISNSITEGTIDSVIEKLTENIEAVHPFVYEPSLPIIFHGIHQFSPMILRTIESVSKYKEVILLFNYNSTYKKTFETWKTVYETFGVQIENKNINENITGKDYKSSEADKSYIKMTESSLLGEQLAMILEGRMTKSAKVPLQSVKLIAFNNTTEFARYISEEYERALEKSKSFEGERGLSVLSFMNEQFYAADSNVNKILKIYHPEQFGEQRFLNYPIGRFFVAIAHMWDTSKENVVNVDRNDIYDCLHSGIIMNDREGRIAETFLQCNEYLGGDVAMSLAEICNKIRSLSKSISGLKLEKHPEYRQIAYFNIKKENLDLLLKGLEQLGKIAEIFFADFEEHQVTFRQFYHRIEKFLNKKVETISDLDTEFRNVMERMLIRLQAIDFPELNPSFSCLRRTMAYYLDQEEQRSAHWIVRNFEQIDGDILRSKVQKFTGHHTVYHFCCLSDDNMTVGRSELFPWPLDEKFFNIVCNVNSVQYRVYLTSRKERRNFKRYALIAGLINNQTDVKISYIKNQKERRTEPYYLLKILGVPEEEYTLQLTANYPTSRVDIMLPIEKQRKEFNKDDIRRFALCPFKFAIDSLLDQETIYKNHFMIKKYLGILLAEKVGNILEWDFERASSIDQNIREQYDQLRRDFSHFNDSEWVDIIEDAKQNLDFDKSQDDINKEKRFLDVRIALKNLKNANKLMPKDTNLVEQFNNAATQYKMFWKRSSRICKHCVDREICMMSSGDKYL